MAINTGAALLDAIVLAVVAREEQGTYGYKNHPGSPAGAGSVGIPPCILCCAVCRRMDA